MATLVYRYGLRPPVEQEDLVRAQRWGAAASLLRPDPADPMIPLEEMRHP